jgi:hypothetical protein
MQPHQITLSMPPECFPQRFDGARTPAPRAWEQRYRWKRVRGHSIWQVLPARGLLSQASVELRTTLHHCSVRSALQWMRGHEAAPHSVQLILSHTLQGILLLPIPLLWLLISICLYPDNRIHTHISVQGSLESGIMRQECPTLLVVLVIGLLLLLLLHGLRTQLPRRLGYRSSGGGEHPSRRGATSSAQCSGALDRWAWARYLIGPDASTERSKLVTQ